MAIMNAASESFSQQPDMGYKPPSELLRADAAALERDTLTPEDRANLNLRSASPEEWEDLEQNLEQLDVAKAERRDDAAEAAKRERAHQEMASNQFGELMIRTLLQLSKQDASFASKPKAEQYLAAFQLCGGHASERIIQPLFPHDPSLWGSVLMRAYASFLEDQRLEPADEASLQTHAQAYLDRFMAQRVGASKEAGLLSEEEANRASNEDLATRELASSGGASAASFAEADRSGGVDRSEGGPAMFSLSALEANENPEQSGVRPRTSRAAAAARRAAPPPAAE